jgi:hypothetical protein
MARSARLNRSAKHIPQEVECNSTGKGTYKIAQINKTYVIWINSQKFKSFKDVQRNAAIPYLLVFKTAQ